MRSLALTLALLVASSAQANPVDGPLAAYWSFWFDVTASDGVTQTFDLALDHTGFETIPGAAITSTVEVTGTTGVILPAYLLSGAIHVDVPEQSFNAGTGRFSHRATSLTFTSVEADVTGDPLALAPIRGLMGDIGSMLVPGQMHVAGVWDFGAAAIPFDSIVDEWARTEGDNYQGLSFSFLMGSEGYNPLIPPLTFSEGGIDYTGSLRMQVFAFVPEPGTAVLLGLGMLVIGLASRPRAASTRVAASPPV